MPLWRFVIVSLGRAVVIVKKKEKFRRAIAAKCAESECGCAGRLLSRVGLTPRGGVQKISTPYSVHVKIRANLRSMVPMYICT